MFGVLKVEVVTAENLVEDTIKETVPVICICSPCLIRTKAVNKDVINCRRDLTRKKIPPMILTAHAQGERGGILL